MTSDVFGSCGSFETEKGAAVIYRLDALAKELGLDFGRLPFSIRILLEGLLRNCGNGFVTAEEVKSLASWNDHRESPREIPFMPSRVLMQDFTGVPAIVDLAAMRAAAARLGGDPRSVNPLVPVELVIDHSVQVDIYGSPSALEKNAEMEFHRNRERYEFLNWGSKAFKNLHIVPPATGICHQVNLEFLGRLVEIRDGQVFPDTLVGTDSHTPMINGLGILGWGVGGIEAEAVMLGQPLYILTPQVVGFRLFGHLRKGVTATDLTLTVVQMLRKKGVVDKFVEFYGPGVSEMSLPDRATIANMAPEYGATVGFFPIDEETVRYLRYTNRSEAQVSLAERYAKAQGLFRRDDAPLPEFSDTLELDMNDVEMSLAGPKRPFDRVALPALKSSFHHSLTASFKEQGFGLAEDASVKRMLNEDDGFRPVDPLTEGASARKAGFSFDGKELSHGIVAIAAITSCTNTSNPSVMLGAGIVARKAVEKGLKSAPHVKTSLAPGSKAVTEYLSATGLLPYLEALGFHLVGYGCTTCIGNSGPLDESFAKALTDKGIVATAVLSGNRNFEGRINPHVKASYLASPPLVVAYAIAGTVDIDLSSEPLGRDREGNPVYLRDIWPGEDEIAEMMQKAVDPHIYGKVYADVYEGNPVWNEINQPGSDLYPWSGESTYIHEPPFFEGLSIESTPQRPIREARVLALLGDSITTDHISPAGDIPEDSPAGRYLTSRGIARKDFNSYGSRRGNDQVMVRGTFANTRLKNMLVPGSEGGVTRFFSSKKGAKSDETMSIYDAAQHYMSDGVPLIIIAGKEYGTGSSRDWAAKGTTLLGVKAVIAESFERIHRNNLVGMGVLPLQFRPGESAASLGITGSESFSLGHGNTPFTPGQDILVKVERDDKPPDTFTAVVRLDSPVEIEYYLNGGILNHVLRKLMARELVEKP
jgi:aconitate hydratase